MSMKSGRKGDSAALLTFASKGDATLIPVPMFGKAEMMDRKGDAGIIDPTLPIFGKVEMMARNKVEMMAPKGDAGFDIFFPFFGKQAERMPPKEDAGFDNFFPFFGKQAEMMTPKGVTLRVHAQDHDINVLSFHRHICLINYKNLMSS
nr:LLDR protein Lu8-2811 [Linum usitatissimum]FAA04153.1 TPA: flax LLDR protein Lu8-2811 [Linum usitatissimum]